MSSVSALAPLTRIGDDVYFYEPAGPPDPEYNGPSLIVMMTWLGGSSGKNISRYVAGHRQLFQDAALLLVTARISEITITPFARMHERMRPARDIIIQYVLGGRDSSSSSSSILWHAFSNGGLNMAIQLARITRKELASKPVLSDRPLADLDSAMGGIILDCCPGEASLHKTFKAAAYSLPKTWAAQTIGRGLLFPAIALLLGWQGSGIMSREGSLGGLYRCANDPTVFGAAVRRMYLYTVSDKLVSWRYVNQHMAEAKEKGFTVDGEAIPGGSHCALLRGDADKYWRAVERFWGECADRQELSRGDTSVNVQTQQHPPLEMDEVPAAIALFRSRL